MKKLFAPILCCAFLIFSPFSTFSVFAETGEFSDDEGEALHEESCVRCHIVHHDADFYTRKNRRIDTLPRLHAQVVRCAQNFNLGWFPDEEQSVGDYLNQNFYHFKKAVEAPQNGGEN